MISTKAYNLARRYKENSSKWAFITACGIILCLSAFRFFLLFSYNGEIGGIDNNFVFDVVRGLNGNQIYTNPAQAPYAITLYPPLYYMVCTFIGNLLHIDPVEPINVYKLCRSISFACDIVTCLYLYAIIRKVVGLPRELTLMVIACFASILCWLGYTFSRCDSMLLAFYAVTIYILLRSRGSFKFSTIITLALLSAACIFSKQNGIITPVIIVTWLYCFRSGKMAAYYAIAVALIMAFLLFICNYIYPYFFDNIVTALMNRIDGPWFYVYIFKRTMDSLWILPLYVSFVLSVRTLLSPVKPLERSLAAIFVIQFLFSFTTTLKWGSTAGYFNESFFLASIILAKKLMEYNQKRNADFVRKWVAIFLPLFALFAVHTLLQGYLFFIQRQPEKKAGYTQQKEISTYLKSQPGGYLVMNIANPNTDFFKTLLSSRIAVPNIDMVECCTYPDKSFDYSLLKRDLSNGNIRYLIANKTDNPTDIWGISLGNFVKDTTIYQYTIYVAQPGNDK